MKALHMWGFVALAMVLTITVQLSFKPHSEDVPNTSRHRPLSESNAIQTNPPNDATATMNSDVVADDCQYGYMSYLLAQFMDIDFIEFVMKAHPSPSQATIVDVGLYQADEVLLMANRGFRVIGFEPNPYRFGKCEEQVNASSATVRSRIKLHNAAITNSRGKMYFQLAGLDSHVYVPKDGEPLKPKTVVVNTIALAEVLADNPSIYYLKIDTQGFDTTILESVLPALESQTLSVTFIQFEFTAMFESERAGRTPEQHKKLFLRLQRAGYDLFQGATTQPWIRSHRSTYGKTPLSMLAVDPLTPTCVEDLVDHLHASRNKAVHAGKTSTDMGSWMDILAVKRLRKIPFYRHTGWVYAKRM
eukprot:PhM_4_TR16356/c0_g1_i1/m.67122